VPDGTHWKKKRYYVLERKRKQEPEITSGEDSEMPTSEYSARKSAVQAMIGEGLLPARGRNPFVFLCARGKKRARAARKGAGVSHSSSEASFLRSKEKAAGFRPTTGE